MKLAFLIILFSCTLYAQPSAKEILALEGCDHKSNSMARFDAVKLLPLVQIEMFNGKELTYKHPELKGIHILNIDPTTALPNNFQKAYKNKFWWIMYSTCDNHIYVITEPTPLQLKPEAKPNG